MGLICKNEIPSEMAVVSAELSHNSGENHGLATGAFGEAPPTPIAADVLRGS